MKSETKNIQRLQKILAASGLASRRKCEEFISAGRVTVDGKVATIGDKADPERQDIRLDGKGIKLEKKVYYLLNKPIGYICSAHNERSRKTIFDLVQSREARLFSIGRLDRDSEGLIILTNDGDFAQKVGHPSNKIEKTYYVETDNIFKQEDLEKLKAGIILDGVKSKVSNCKLIKSSPARSSLLIGLVEGKNREVRRLLARLGYEVSKLVRIRIGQLNIKGLKEGCFRPLSNEEKNKLLGVS